MQHKGSFRRCRVRWKRDRPGMVWRERTTRAKCNLRWSCLRMADGRLFGYFVCQNCYLYPSMAPMPPNQQEVREQCNWSTHCLFMAAVWNRAGHYIFVLFLLLFSSPNLSGNRLDVYHTSTHGVNLECRSEMCCTRLAGNAVPKNRHLGWGTITQLCRAISSQLRHVSIIGKNLLNGNTAPTSPQYGELRPWDRFVSLGNPS